MLAVEKMDDIKLPREASCECQQLCVEVAELVPGHPPARDEPLQGPFEAPEPTRQIGIAVRCAVQNGSKALWIEPAHELGITGMSAKLRIARVFEPDSNGSVSVSPHRGDQV